MYQSFLFCLSLHLLQFLNGFPVKPFGQKHIGLPWSSSQSAFKPQGLGSQGSEGAEQAILGLPVYPFGHLQTER